MRKHGRVDGNHTAVVKALRQIGASVVSLADVGGGCADLLVGRNGVNLLLEVKNGDVKPSERRLTEDELKFHAEWRGQVALVFAPLEAVEYVMEHS